MAPNNDMQYAQQVSEKVFLSAETDKLFQKWLKLQIAGAYWGMVSRIVIFLLIAGSIVISTLTLAPIVQSQLGLLQNLQSTMNSISSGTYGTSKSIETMPSNNVNDIIDQLTPEQKALIIQSLEKKKK